jgi:hypothetical protein
MSHPVIMNMRVRLWRNSRGPLSAVGILWAEFRKSALKEGPKRPISGRKNLDKTIGAGLAARPGLAI